MSALAFLSGLASGYGSETSKIQEQQRAFSQQKDLAAGKALLDHLGTPAAEAYDWPTYSGILQDAWKKLGVKADPQVLQHMKGVWDSHQQQKDQQRLQSESQNLASSGPQVGPGGELTPGSPLPNVPQAPTTLGDINRGQQTQNIGVTNTGQINLQSGLSEVQLQKMREQLDILDKQDQKAAGQHPNNGLLFDPSESHYKVVRGMTTNGVTEQLQPDNGIRNPTPLRGDDIKSHYPAFNGNDRDYYSEIRYSRDGSRFEPTIPKTTNLPVQLAQPDGSTKWAEVKVDPQNRLVGEPNYGIAVPASMQSRTTSGTQDVWKVNPATGQLEKVTQGTQRTVSPTNQNLPQAAVPTQAGPTGAIPTAPGTSQGTTQKTSSPSTAKGYIGIYGGPAGTVPVPSGGKPNSIDPRTLYLIGQVASGRLKLSDIKGDGVSQTDKQVRGAVQSGLADLGLDVNKVTTSQLDTANFAKTLADKYPHIMALVDKLDQEGKLGPIAGRFNEFMTGKIGAGDPEYTALRNDLGLIQTALMKVHTGSRGSTTIMSKMANLINGTNMTPEALRASLNEAKLWIDAYSQLVPTGEQALGKVGTGRGGASPTGDIPSQLQIGGSFNGGKILKVERVQ